MDLVSGFVSDRTTEKVTETWLRKGPDGGKVPGGQHSGCVTRVRMYVYSKWSYVHMRRITVYATDKLEVDTLCIWFATLANARCFVKLTIDDGWSIAYEVVLEILGNTRD